MRNVRPFSRDPSFLMQHSAHPFLGQLILAGSMILAGSIVSHAATTVSFSGPAYTQDFNSLPVGTTGTLVPWNDATAVDTDTLPGWSLVLSTGANPTQLTVNDGSQPNLQGRFYSAGTLNSPDRALGTQSPDATSTFQRLGLGLTNDTGATVDSFSLAYTAEQWRTVSPDDLDTLAFEYQVFNAGAVDPLEAATGWTAISSLNFLTPINDAAASGALNGNLAANRAQLSGGVTSGLSWQSGQELWLRWSDSNPTGGDLNRQVMAIDDLTFTAVPEPSAVSMMALGALGLLHRRRQARA